MKDENHMIKPVKLVYCTQIFIIERKKNVKFYKMRALVMNFKKTWFPVSQLY